MNACHPDRLIKFCDFCFRFRNDVVAHIRLYLIFTHLEICNRVSLFSCWPSVFWSVGTGSERATLAGSWMKCDKSDLAVLRECYYRCLAFRGFANMKLQSRSDGLEKGEFI